MIKKLKLKDKTGISRQYQIAISNPTIMTVAALQDTWIRVVDFWMKSAEESPSKTDSEAIAKIEALSSLQPAYCEYCARWFVYLGDHNANHTIGKREKFIRASEVLSILSAVKSSEGQKEGSE